jgi:glycosyltransferase involved in cell wall biosynthesis
VFCCHWSLLPVAVLFKVLFGSKIVYEAYDYSEIMLKAFGSRFQKCITYFVIKLFKKWFLRFYDLILCIHLKDSVHLAQLKKFNPNVVEIHNYTCRKWAGARILKPDRHAKVAFVYMGGVFKRKGCKLAADAFLTAFKNERTFQAEMHFFGRYGDPSLLKWLDGQPRVFIHREMPPDQIRNLMRDRLCVGLLLYEKNLYYDQIGTNSQKTYEYLAAGFPIIASRLGETEQMLLNNDIGYLVESDIQVSDLANLLISIAKDRDELARKASNATIFISENQMWIEREWEKVLATGLLGIELKANLVTQPSRASSASEISEA